MRSYHRGFWTPLHDAASKGDEEMVKHLLVSGASKELQDAEGYTLFYWATEKSHEAIVVLLMLAGTPSLDKIISLSVFNSESDDHEIAD